MEVKIKATKIDLTDAIKVYIDKKMDMLEKYLGDITVTHCEVEVGMITNKHNKGNIYRAEVNLSIPGELLRVEKTEADLYKAIDKVKDHLQLMIKKHKEKLIDKKRKNG